MNAVNLGAGRLATTRRLRHRLYQRLLESDSRWVGVLLAEWSDPIARGGVLLLLNTRPRLLADRRPAFPASGVACGPPAYLASCLGRSR